MFPGAGLYLPKTMARSLAEEEVDDGTEARHKIRVPQVFSRRSFDWKSASRESVAMERASSSTENLNTNTAARSTSRFAAFRTADFNTPVKKAPSEHVVFAELIQSVRRDEIEASCLRNSPAVVDFCGLWPDKQAFIDHTLSEAQLTLKEIGTAFDSILMRGHSEEDTKMVVMKQKAGRVLSHQKKLANRQESLRVYHKRLMKAIALMRLVEADGAAALEDIVYETPAPPYIQHEADENMRSPYARKGKKNFSMQSIPSVLISGPTESQMEVFHTNSINETLAELAGGMPSNITSHNMDLDNPPTPATLIPGPLSAAPDRGRHLSTAYVPSSQARAWTLPIFPKPCVTPSTDRALTRPHSRSDPPHSNLKQSTIPLFADRQLFDRVLSEPKAPPSLPVSLNVDLSRPISTATEKHIKQEPVTSLHFPSRKLISNLHTHYRVIKHSTLPSTPTMQEIVQPPYLPYLPHQPSLASETEISQYMYREEQEIPDSIIRRYRKADSLDILSTSDLSSTTNIALVNFSSISYRQRMTSEPDGFEELGPLTSLTISSALLSKQDPSEDATQHQSTTQSSSSPANAASSMLPSSITLAVPDIALPIVPPPLRTTKPDDTASAYGTPEQRDAQTSKGDAGDISPTFSLTMTSKPDAEDRSDSTEARDAKLKVIPSYLPMRRDRPLERRRPTHLVSRKPLPQSPSLIPSVPSIAIANGTPQDQHLTDPVLEGEISRTPPVPPSISADISPSPILSKETLPESQKQELKHNPMNSQAKRRAAHQRRMQTMFESD